MKDDAPCKLDAMYWKRLRALPPPDVAGRSKCVYSESFGYYEVNFLGSMVWVDPHRERFLSPHGEVMDLSLEDSLPILVYLAEAQNIPLAERLVSPKDIKGGEMFFRGPHSFPVAPLEQAFGDNKDGFLAAGEKCGGVPGTLGDASFQVMAFPRVPLQVLLWLTDEDFPAQISFLFDATIEQHFPLDVIFALVCALCFRLGVVQ